MHDGNKRNLNLILFACAVSDETHDFGKLCAHASIMGMNELIIKQR